MGKKKYLVYIALAMTISGFSAYLFENRIVVGSSISKIVPVKFSDGLPNGNTNVISHRAQCSGEPENSMKAIKSSIRSKADYAEIDVQETKDGVIVLMHDRNLKRLTGLNKNVDDMNFIDLEKLNIAPQRFGFHKERIPTLDEVVKQCKGKLKLIIEIKPYGNTEDLTNKVVGIVERNNFENQCKVHSFSYKILLNVKKLNPEIQTGYIVSGPLDKPLDYLDSLNVNFYSVIESCVTKQLVNDIHKKNRGIYVWTVNDEPAMKNLIELHVDGIITDQPNLLQYIKNNNTPEDLTGVI